MPNSSRREDHLLVSGTVYGLHQDFSHPSDDEYDSSLIPIVMLEDTVPTKERFDENGDPRPAVAEEGSSRWTESCERRPRRARAS